MPRAAVLNAESRLQSLVNDVGYTDCELIPRDLPTFQLIPVSATESVMTAFQYRPEVAQAVKQIRAACIRMNMSKNELLPVLNLITETYVSGLEDDGQAFDAWARQFDTGEPSYGIGLQYEVPMWNRAAKARLQRRRLEVRQLQNQYATTLETIRLEVAVAVREIETSGEELSTKQQAMRAACHPTGRNDETLGTPARRGSDRPAWRWKTCSPPKNSWLAPSSSICSHS